MVTWRKTNEKLYRQRTSILGVVLNKFVILATMLLTLTIGIVGGIAIILSIIDVLLGIKARNLGGKGIALSSLVRS